MKRICLALVLSFSFSPFSHGVSKVDDICQLPEMDLVERATSRVYFSPASKSGSGFFYGASDLYFTAYHTIDNLIGERVYTVVGDGVEVDLTNLLRVSKAHDLALFRVERGSEHYLTEVGEEVPKSDEGLCLMGFPQREFRRVSKTYLATYGDNNAYEFATNWHQHLGGSGGPIVNGEGKLVGMLMAKNDNFVLTSSPGIINSFLEGEIGFACNETPMLECIAEEEEKFLREATSSTASAFLKYRLYYQHFFNGRTRYEDSLIFSLLQESADAGYALAEYDWGITILENQGRIPDLPDLAVGLEYINRAAEKKLYDAMYFQCGNYVNGRYIEKDIPSAVECLTTLAEDYGSIQAQLNLANLYLFGHHGLYNIENAIKYFTLAGEQGHQKAKDIARTLGQRSGRYHREPR